MIFFGGKHVKLKQRYETPILLTSNPPPSHPPLNVASVSMDLYLRNSLV